MARALPGTSWTVTAVAQPAAALAHAMRATPRVDDSRLHLLDRSAAWYSAGTIATPPAPVFSNRMLRFLLISIASAAFWMMPAASFGQEPQDSLELQGLPGAVLAGGAARGCLALLRLRRGRGAHRLRRAPVLRRLHRDLQEEGFRQRHGTRRFRVGRHPHLPPTAPSSTRGREQGRSTTPPAR